MGEPTGPTYTTSTAASIAGGTFIWVVLVPVSGSLAASWPYDWSGSGMLYVYVQNTKPVITDTPVHSEAVGGIPFETLYLFSRGGDSVISSLEWTSEDLFTFNTGFTPTGPREVPAKIAEGPTGVPNVSSTIVQSNVYLGTDKVYERIETG